MVVATDTFEHLAHLTARHRGAPDARVLVVPHPLGGMPVPAVEATAARAVDALWALLYGVP